MSTTIDLSSLRKSLGLKQAELAERIGIKQAYLSELENGKKPIPTSLYNTMIETFGEDVCDTFAISQDELQTSQNFNAPILGNNPQFAGHDFNIGMEVDKIISAMKAQADLTKDAHEITKRAQDQVDRAQAQVDKAQSQMDRLLAMLETKLNITQA